jgi:CBS domain-containing protein
MKAADVMISTVISVDPDARVEEVARILQGWRLRCGRCRAVGATSSCSSAGDKGRFPMT